jgi:hypothetical protein
MDTHKNAPRIRISLCDGASARCSASNRQDQPSASSLLTPPSTTPLMPSAISHPAPRSAPSEAKRSRRGGLRLPPEPELKLPAFTPLLRAPVTAPQGWSRFLAQMTGDGVREPPGFRRQPRCHWRPMMILSRVCSYGIGDEAEKRPRPWDASMKVGITTSMRGAD